MNGPLGVDCGCFLLSSSEHTRCSAQQTPRLLFPVLCKTPFLGRSTRSGWEIPGSAKKRKELNKCSRKHCYRTAQVVKHKFLFCSVITFCCCADVFAAVPKSVKTQPQRTAKRCLPLSLLVWRLLFGLPLADIVVAIFQDNEKSYFPCKRKKSCLWSFVCEAIINL